MAEKKLTITIKNELSINNVEAWYKKNKANIIKSNEILINLLNINQLDVAGLQVIHAIKKLPGKKVTINAELNDLLSHLLERTAVTNILN